MNISANILNTLPKPMPQNRIAGDALAEKPGSQEQGSNGKNSFDFASLIAESQLAQATPLQEYQESAVQSPELIEDVIVDAAADELNLYEDIEPTADEVITSEVAVVDVSTQNDPDDLQVIAANLAADLKANMPDESVVADTAQVQSNSAPNAAATNTVNNAVAAVSATAAPVVSAAPAFMSANTNPQKPPVLGAAASIIGSQLSGIATSGATFGARIADPASNTGIEPPRMFRSSADSLITQTPVASEASQQALNTATQTTQARNSNILDLFANRAPAATAQNPGNAQANPFSAAVSNINTNNVSNAGQVALNVPSNVVVNSPVMNAAGQIPVLPLSTIHGISNHVMMQVHPAITERSSPVEASLLTASSLRGNKSIELQLVPRSLGVVEMKIVNQDGVIKITIQTETAEAQRLIRSEAASMMETFRSAGLKLEEFNISQNSRLDSSSLDRENRQDGAAFQDGRSQDDQALNDRSSNDSRDNQFDLQGLTMTDDLLDATPEEAQLARTGLYL